MPSILALMLALAAGDPLTPPPIVSGRVTMPADAGDQPVLVVVRDSARGITRSVTTRQGRFAIPVDRAGATLVAMTLDGRWAAEAAAVGSPALTLVRASEPRRRLSSAAWLARLPDGETRRKFVLDCTGCHQFDDSRALLNGSPRPASGWTEAVTRMLGYAGPRSNFPVISSWAEDPSVPEWLAAGVARPAAPAAPAPAVLPATVTEFDTPVASDLPHDVAIDSAGGVLVTGMMSHAMYRLDPESARFERIEIPVPRANPRAVELDRAGAWWVLLGAPGKVGRYDPTRKDWRFFDIGMYPHSIAVAGDGKVWFNGHFTRDPEQIGVIDPASGKVSIHDLTPHPTMATIPGGPIPYEQRIGPDGRVWVSELQGNRIVEFDPRTGRSRAHVLPTSASGPRRFDIDDRGVLWIPAYSANTLVRFDPATGAFAEYPLPVAGATPYIARFDRRSGAVWIGTSAADAAFRFDPRTRTFAMVPLPSQGSLTRHLVVDPRNGDVWLAYGASPARIPSRIARIQIGGGS